MSSNGNKTGQPILWCTILGPSRDWSAFPLLKTIQLQFELGSRKSTTTTSLLCMKWKTPNHFPKYCQTWSYWKQLSGWTSWSWIYKQSTSELIGTELPTLWSIRMNVCCSPWHQSFMLRYLQLSGSLMVHLLHHQIPSGVVSNFPWSLLAYVQQYSSKSLASVPCM